MNTLPSFTLRRLWYFVAVADELHFGRAAERLHMAQPPLSQQIRQLESDLGVELFERTTRSVRLTDAGEAFLVEARRVLTAAEATERLLHEFEFDGGVLRLGFVDSAAYQVMPEFLQEYRRRWPNTTYDLRSMSSDEQFAALEAGQIDVGISRVSGYGEQIRSVQFLREPLYLAVGGSHALRKQRSVSMSRLKGARFISFDRRVSPTLHAELVSMLALAEVTFDPVIEATEYATILGLVAADEGVAIVPAGVRTLQPPRLSYVRLRDERAALPLMLMASAGSRLRMVDRAFDLIAELFDAPS